MLELRPNCECCDRDLPPDSADARICTFECTFCVDCVETRFSGVCPNCGGDLSARPIRPAGGPAPVPRLAEARVQGPPRLRQRAPAAARTRQPPSVVRAQGSEAAAWPEAKGSWA
jgi:hypothetical protein